MVTRWAMAREVQTARLKSLRRPINQLGVMDLCNGVLTM